MASTPKDLLPTPGSWTQRSLQARGQTTSGMRNTYRPDPALDPRLFTFVWAEGPVADAARRHYDDHFADTFTVKLPRTAEVVTVQWFSPPSIKWTTPTAASLVGELEEVLAHE